MSGPKMAKNPRKILPGANISRPSGCSELATELDPERLAIAIETGNRATRREAIRNLIKQAREWANTPEGKRAMAEQWGEK